MNETEDNRTLGEPIKVPKKRGRKRKAEVQPQVEPASPRPDTSPADSSRSKRRRKQVNYYELANPGVLEAVAEDAENNHVKPEDGEKKSPRPRKNIKAKKNKSSNGHVAINDLEDLTVTSAVEKYSPSQGEALACETNNHHATNSLDIGADMEEGTTVRNGATENNELSEANNDESSTSNSAAKNKKYNYTGETVKMMDTLFTLFNNKVESSHETTTNTNPDVTNISNDTPSKRKSKKEVDKVGDGVNDITCAVCNQTMDKTLWTHHKQRYHNNLAWRVGDSPLDLSDKSFVMYTLNTLYKKKKPLYCETCGEAKKSVVGFLSHKSTCRMSEGQLESVKKTCEICGKKMLPVSLATHMKLVHTNPKNSDDVEATNNETKSTSGSSRRSAAKKALKFIENIASSDSNEDSYVTSDLNFKQLEYAKVLLTKEFGSSNVVSCRFQCEFPATNLDELLKHHEECQKKVTEGFACRQCLLVFNKLEDVYSHIEAAHNIVVETDRAFTYEPNDDGNDRGGTYSKLPNFVKVTVKRAQKNLFGSAFNWTYKFHEENFSPILYKDLSVVSLDWPLMSPHQIKEFIPKMSQSCDVAYTSVKTFKNLLEEDYTFKRYGLFESEMLEDNKITMFCGGPVSSLSWLPTPFTKDDENQILAVSVLNGPEERFSTTENYQIRSAIQFWNFGRLKNEKTPDRPPNLAFNLAHNFGPVWHMEWCPSGCYNIESNRMGLLAVGGSDPVVHIYAIPFFKETDNGLYYKPRPVLKLLLQRPQSALLGGIRYYPSKISWSKASGHCYVSVGYTNGFVALFNLEKVPVLLKHTDSEGVKGILPIKCFQAHPHSISALALHHLNGGNRWLMTASWDRNVNIWDLENVAYPICSSKKNIVTDGFWFTNWLSSITSADEGSTTAYIQSTLKQIREFSHEPAFNLIASSSTISSVSGSDWLNGIIQGNTVGEITAIFPHQLFYLPDHQKSLRKKRLLFGYTSLIDKSKSPEERKNEYKRKKKAVDASSSKNLTTISSSKSKPSNDSNLLCNEPIMYHEAQERYALLFCDNSMKTYDDFPDSLAEQLSGSSKYFGFSQPNQYPLNAINKVVFNPNKQACLYYATGYQAGFVRVSWMQFLKNDEQVK